MEGLKVEQPVVLCDGALRKFSTKFPFHCLMSTRPASVLGATASINRANASLHKTCTWPCATNGLRDLHPGRTFKNTNIVQGDDIHSEEGVISAERISQRVAKFGGVSTSQGPLLTRTHTAATRRNHHQQPAHHTFNNTTATRTIETTCCAFSKNTHG